MIRRLVLALFVASLVSCRTQPPQPAMAPQPLPAFPLEIYRPASDKVVFKLDGEHSRADIVVRRGGKLARFGHDHVVSAEHIDGYVLVGASELKGSRADLRLSLNSLTVDKPAARAQFALDTHPSEQDIEKTRGNMRAKVLQTDTWPQAHLKVEITGGTPDAPEALITMYLHGAEHRFPVTFTAEGLETPRLRVTGVFSLRQSDFGIQPFSVLGGGLQVLDQVDVTFLLLADRIGSTVPVP